MRSAFGVTIITLLLGAAPVAAQIAPASGQPSANRNERKGFWIGFGLGYGSAGFDCSACPATRRSDATLYLKLGGTVNQHLLLGGEVSAWARSEGGIDESLAFVNGTLTWYPSAEGAAFLKIGAGSAAYLSTDAAGNSIDASAISAILGAGYDWRVGRNFSITPFVNAIATTRGRFTNGQNTLGSDISFNLLQIGVGATWH